MLKAAWGSALVLMISLALRRVARQCLSSNQSALIQSRASSAQARTKIDPAPSIPPPLPSDIEEIHRTACQQQQRSYKDPSTGFSVFTELAHLDRGKCCGSRCRHCPFEWQNVKQNKFLRGATESRSRSVQKGSKKKSRPYTRTGDKGTSALFTGVRVAKDDAVFEALGTIDELNSFVGLAHSSLNAEVLRTAEGQALAEQLEEVMSRLLDVGSHVATPRTSSTNEAQLQLTQFDPRHIQLLEGWIDQMTDKTPTLSSFVLPSGDDSSARLHVARTVCRRAERRVVALVSLNDEWQWDGTVVRYLNRLSDYLFSGARLVLFLQGKTELGYSRASNDDVQRTVQKVQE